MKGTQHICFHQKMAMAKTLLIFVALVFFFSVAAFSVAEARDGNLQEESQKAYGKDDTWCIAKPSEGDTNLQANIDFVCTEVGIDCSIIRSGGACFLPATTVSHASVVMNLYYKQFQQQPSDCYFAGTGLIVQADPSVGKCDYA